MSRVGSLNIRRHIPVHARAVFDALHFGEPKFGVLDGLSETEWRLLLKFCDRTQLTIPFALRCHDRVPDWVAARLEQNLQNNAERWRRIRSAYGEVASEFSSVGIEFVVLKGFSHAPAFVSSPSLRAQGDFDLWFAADQVRAALDVALTLGYEPIDDNDPHPIDHLPTLVRKTGWEWRGDFFDPEMPLSLELHFRLWDRETEGFAIANLDDFWDRRERRTIEGLEFSSLSAIDLPGYACAHALRHLLRGDLRPSHIYEVANFLERRADPELTDELAPADDFWHIWRTSHDDTLRRVQAICFAMARQWFGCRLPSAASEEMARLPEPVRDWLTRYEQTPGARLFDPAKNELWLHLALLDPGYSPAAIIRRRLVPSQLPGPADAAHLPSEAITWKIRVRSAWRYAWFATGRVWHHMRALVPTLSSGAAWAWRQSRLDASFWSYFAASACFNVGLFIFFLLFNLYLLKAGYTESFLGLVSGSTLAGSVLGSIPAGIVIERLGVRNSMLACLSIIPVMAAMMASGLPPPLLLGCAFIYGVTSVMWAVLLSPAIAALTNERNRGSGFSIICSSGIGIGIVASAIGGRLPGLVSHFAPHASVVAQYRIALWIGCAIVLSGLIPSAKIRSRTPPAAVNNRAPFRRPPTPVIYFLAAVAVWSLGTGAFNPFFNAFFARMHMAVDRIGLLVSISQLGQTLAVLAAPLVFRSIGLIRGISRMQLLSALALVLIAASGGPGTAALAYAAYMMVQNMSEPGMLNYLMDVVPEAERSAISAWNFLVASGAQAVAAVVSGVLLRRFGYPPVLLLAAALCAIAGILVRLLLTKKQRPTHLEAKAAQAAL